jgi:hypothetical protein
MADLRNFYPDVYMKLGAGVTLTTQPALTTALASWTHVHGSEAGAEIKEAKGKEVELTTGDKVQLSKMIDGTITLLECTNDNYSYLRATFHNKVCSVIMNEAYLDNTGTVVQVQNIIPFISRDMKSGDLVRIKITFKTEASTLLMDVQKLLAT